MRKVLTTTSIEIDLLDRTDKISVKTNTPKTKIINSALREYLDKHHPPIVDLTTIDPLEGYEEDIA